MKDAQAFFILFCLTDMNDARALGWVAVRAVQFWSIPS
jgi:hypothetical protein